MYQTTLSLPYQILRDYKYRHLKKASQESELVRTHKARFRIMKFHSPVLVIILAWNTNNKEWSVRVIFHMYTYPFSLLTDGKWASNLRCTSTVYNIATLDQIPNDTQGIVKTALCFFNNLQGINIQEIVWKGCLKIKKSNTTLLIQFAILYAICIIQHCLFPMKYWGIYRHLKKQVRKVSLSELTKHVLESWNFIAQC